MYCRMCGNKVEDTDHYCQHCGTPTGYREQSAPSVEEEKKEEEIVFNPPYEPQSHFIEEDPPFEGEEPQDTTQEDEILKEFISESEIKEEFIPDGDDSSARVKNSEFTWNLYEFPGQKQKKPRISISTGILRITASRSQRSPRHRHLKKSSSRRSRPDQSGSKSRILTGSLPSAEKMRSFRSCWTENMKNLKQDSGRTWSGRSRSQPRLRKNQF